MADGPDDAEVQRVRSVYSARHERRDPEAVVLFVVTERREILRNAVERRLGVNYDRLRICDVGCGGGGDLEFWRAEGVPEVALAGTELLEQPITSARKALPNADLRLVAGSTLPWADCSFDVTWASMTLSSITDDERRKTLFDEMHRVTKPGGVVAIYDFRIRKPTNHDVVAMRRNKIHRLGLVPEERTLATPFIPLLAFALALPPIFRNAVLAALPKTHAVWIWKRAGAPLPAEHVVRHR